jgi:hypothetical protein
MSSTPDFNENKLNSLGGETLFAEKFDELHSKYRKRSQD